MTVSDVFRELARNPGRHLFRHWNWKAALLSGILRGTIFFFANLPEGIGAAARAFGLDFPFRLFLAGFYGAIIQAFRRAEPPWAAALTIVFLLAGLTHGIEFLVHYVGGTPRLAASITYSMIFSALSSTFNLFIMRRGTLIVGPASAPLRDDLRRSPGLIVEFLAAAIGLVLSVVRRVGRLVRS